MVSKESRDKISQNDKKEKSKKAKKNINKETVSKKRRGKSFKEQIVFLKIYKFLRTLKINF